MTRSDLPSEPNFALHIDQVRARADAERLFERVAAELRKVLPATADIRHVGATAVSGCLTKGDLDIVVRVAPEHFAVAERVLAEGFARNTGSKRTDTFAAFEDPQTEPHLGIQLTVAGGEDDYFHLFVEALQRDPALVARYNALKLQHAGAPMDAYRAAKSAFIEEILVRLSS
ncbi:GrpB family protein [Hyphomicrobium sp. CS1GBMeth3]|uniref:GrpB family protein n=1 Tax=Hyphomicrobium sp. CS1GBMeth3 TaxID=1892845 RepID=UPI000931FCF0|nr:GrpB family protein [Hyphomicrobium sp. CS1GBMeth3]